MQMDTAGRGASGTVSVTIPIGDVELDGNLSVPPGATGLVVFAHGSGSSRHSPRNRHVAEYLNGRNVGTLLIDLLSSEEEAVDIHTRHLRFDIDMLADRLAAIARWIMAQPQLDGLKIGYFGSSTGSGAALLATARQPDRIAAIVSRGGRPDLAGEALVQIAVPVRLIVGGNDPQVMALNEQSLRLLNERSQLDVVPGATHLFEEPGTLDRVCELAAEWFIMQLRQTMRMIFSNREEAGRRLAEALSDYRDSKDTLVLALPRGGVPVAWEISAALRLPLDLLLVRKLGVPGHEELAMGAIAWGHIRHFNKDIVESLKISQEEIDSVIDREQNVLLERNSLYRKDRPPPQVEGKTVIVVDDGLATGATMKAAVSAMRQAGAGRIVAAVPVGAATTCAELETLADETVCLSTPEPFMGVGRWYADFSQTSDFEVQELLDRAEAQFATTQGQS